MTRRARVLMIAAGALAFAVWGNAAQNKIPAEQTPGAARKVSVTAGKSDLVDINSASKIVLMNLGGIGETYARKIIAGRPYKMKTQLKSRKILPTPIYERIADRIIAKQGGN